MIERAFRATLRDLTTYFLIAAVVFVPLHVGYSLIFQDEIAVSALHEQIAQLPEGDTVRGVAAGSLTTFRIAGWAVLVVEILALPLMVAAALHVLGVRSGGQLPSVVSAWSAAPRNVKKLQRAPRTPGILLSSAVVAIAIGTLARAAGMLMLEPLSDSTLWAGVALIEATARSLAAPFVMVPAAFLERAH